MTELDEMLKKFITAFVLFIIFAFLLGISYDILLVSIENALTGNWQYDSLIYIIPIAFGGGVIMILWAKYIPHGDD